MPPIGLALGFEAIALGESLHDPKGGVRKECLVRGFEERDCRIVCYHATRRA